MNVYCVGYFRWFFFRSLFSCYLHADRHARMCLAYRRLYSIIVIICHTISFNAIFFLFFFSIAKFPIILLHFISLEFLVMYFCRCSSLFYQSKKRSEKEEVASPFSFCSYVHYVRLPQMLEWLLRKWLSLLLRFSIENATTLFCLHPLCCV